MWAHTFISAPIPRSSRSTLLLLFSATFISSGAKPPCIDSPSRPASVPRQWQYFKCTRLIAHHTHIGTHNHCTNKQNKRKLHSTFSLWMCKMIRNNMSIASEWQWQPLNVWRAHTCLLSQRQIAKKSRQSSRKSMVFAFAHDNNLWSKYRILWFLAVASSAISLQTSDGYCQGNTKPLKSFRYIFCAFCVGAFLRSPPTGRYKHLPSITINPLNSHNSQTISLDWNCLVLFHWCAGVNGT